jgi:hypothetical protein
MSEWYVICRAFLEGPFPTAKEAEEAAERFDADDFAGVACGPHRVERDRYPFCGKLDHSCEHARGKGEPAAGRKLVYVGRPSKLVAEMSDEELDAYAAKVVEALERDRRIP